MHTTGTHISTKGIRYYVLVGWREVERSSQKISEVKAELFNLVMALQKEGFFAQLQQGLQGQGEAEGVGRDDVQTAVLAEHEVSQRRSCHSSRKPCWNYPTGQE